MNTTLRGFIDKHGITAEVERAEDNPNIMADVPGATHYRVTLRNERGAMVVPYTMGPALPGEPDAWMVLGSVALDISLIEEHDDPIELVIELGGEIETSEDVDKARATYEVLQGQHAELERMIGTEAMQELLYEVER